MPTQQYDTVANASGVATIEIRSRPENWTVQQVNIKMPAAVAGTVCEISKNRETGIPAAAARDTVSGEPYIDLLRNDVLRIVWTGATAGASASASIIYQSFR